MDAFFVPLPASPTADTTVCASAGVAAANVASKTRLRIRAFMPSSLIE
jgi:hypothetical protein